MFQNKRVLKKTSLFLLLLFVVGCSYLVEKKIKLLDFKEERLTSSISDEELGIKVKHTFNNRCVVCHSCYNSACRLKMSSFEGLMRGGYKIPIYGGTEFAPQDPLRLGVDETTTKGWRKRGFYPVISEENISGISKVKDSLLFNILTLKRSTRLVPGVLPEKTHVCASNKDEFNEFIQRNTSMGMPYGMPMLTTTEYYEIGEWIRRGALNFDIKSKISTKEEYILNKWDKKLNGESVKNKLSSRYIYEHLFIAHLHFEKIKGKFYRLVRSKTKYPRQIQEIKTVRPYDDPKVKDFYYRFREIETTIVHKTHITYKLSDKKLKRYDELFYLKDWKQKELFLPPYGKYKSNPFVTFMQIPAQSRYQFLLDNAYYHVKTFIRGPVCNGNLALNVIDDHFSVFFLDPKSDLYVNNKDYSVLVNDYLDIPARGEGNNLKSLYRYYKEKQKNYTNERDLIYAKHVKDGFGLNDIWDGDKDNKSATLTIYRHFDSASVMEGFQGGYPKTVWLLDYPIFERIYYNLVAGFDVYGTIFHKSASRQYMDDLRVEGEDNFLSTLPKKVRKPIRDSWYIGNISQLKRKIEHVERGMNRPTKFKFSTGYYIPEFIETIMEKRFDKKIYPVRDDLNCCELKALNMKKILTVKDFEETFRQIINKPNKFIQMIPDLSLIRVKIQNEYKVFTMIRNRAHLNISFIFFEELNLEPANDRINIHRDYVGSYPNKIFDLKIEDANDFFKEMINLDYENKHLFYNRFSISKNDQRIWPIMDWFHKDFKKRFPIESGIFDLSRLDILF